jgi:hypothetical protein
MRSFKGSVVVPFDADLLQGDIVTVTVMATPEADPGVRWQKGGVL